MFIIIILNKSIGIRCTKKNYCDIWSSMIYKQIRKSIRAFLLKKKDNKNYDTINKFQDQKLHKKKTKKKHYICTKQTSRQNNKKLTKKKPTYTQNMSCLVLFRIQMKYSYFPVKYYYLYSFEIKYIFNYGLQGNSLEKYSLKK